MFAENAQTPDGPMKPNEATPSDEVASLAGSMDDQQKAILATMLLSPLPESPAYCGLAFLIPLNDKNVRKELCLSTEQDQRLREISAVVSKQMEELRGLPEQEPPATKVPPAWEQAELLQQYKARQKQVKELLTGEQATILKNTVVRWWLRSLCYQSDDPTSTKLGLDDEQKHKFARLFEDILRLRQPLDDIAARSLAVLSAEQRKKLAAIDVSDPASFVVSARYTSSRSKTAKERADHQRGMGATAEKASFTPQQLPGYQSTALHAVTLASLAMPEFLERLGLSLTEGQQEELRALREGWSDRIGRFCRELGEKCLAILTPEQRGKLQENVDRWWAQF